MIPKRSLVRVQPRPLMSDEELDLDKIFDVPFLFWMCKAHKEQRVKWTNNIATCEICGKRSDDKAGSSEVER